MSELGLCRQRDRVAGTKARVVSPGEGAGRDGARVTGGRGMLVLARKDADPRAGPVPVVLMAGRVPGKQPRE